MTGALILLKTKSGTLQHFVSTKINYTMEYLCDAFELKLNLRSNEASILSKLKLGTECELIVEEGGVRRTVLTGKIDVIDQKIHSKHLELTIEGISAAAPLVTANYDASSHGGTAQWRKIKYHHWAEKMCAPYSIKVEPMADIEMPVMPLICAGADSLHALMNKYAMQHGLILYSTPHGSVQIAQASSAFYEGPKTLPQSHPAYNDPRPLHLEHGKNLLKIEARIDTTNLYSHYIVTGTRPSKQGEDERDCFVKAIYTDAYSPRYAAVRFEFPSHATQEGALRMAMWEANQRRAKAERITLLISGVHLAKNQLAAVTHLDFGYKQTLLRIVESRVIIDSKGARTYLVCTNRGGWEAPSDAMLEFGGERSTNISSWLDKPEELSKITNKTMLPHFYQRDPVLLASLGGGSSRDPNKDKWWLRWNTTRRIWEINETEVHGRLGISYADDLSVAEERASRELLYSAIFKIGSKSTGIRLLNRYTGPYEERPSFGSIHLTRKYGSAFIPDSSGSNTLLVRLGLETQAMESGVYIDLSEVGIRYISGLDENGLPIFSNYQIPLDVIVFHELVHTLQSETLVNQDPYPSNHVDRKYYSPAEKEAVNLTNEYMKEWGVKDDDLRYIYSRNIGFTNQLGESIVPMINENDARYEYSSDRGYPTVTQEAEAVALQFGYTIYHTYR